MASYSRALFSMLFLLLLSLTVVACGGRRDDRRGDDDDDSATNNNDDDDDDDITGDACGYPEGQSSFGQDVGDFLPSLLVGDSAGELHSIDAFCGAALVLHIDAPWNGAFYPASEELTALYNDPDLEGLAILGALIDIENPTDLANLAEENGIPYPLVSTDIDAIGSWGNISGIPHLIVLDSEMRILANGNVSGEALRALVEEQLL
jgi:hypothetical protein